MKKTEKLAAINEYGANWAFEHLEKLAEDDSVSISREDIEKLAELRAQRVLDGVVYLEKLSTMVDVTNNTIKVLADNEFQEAADLISKIAQEELEEVAAPPSIVESGKGEEKGEEKEEEPSEEEAVEAAVQGAAEVIADLTGKSPEDQEVQEAALEIVEEAVEAASEAGSE